jgi:2-polyprenyl-3-methyl-5-hydroxy-6-metoxy-1,4-benzoquinol methylase
MTRLLAPKVERLVALDISTPSLAALNELGFSNVETVETLVEHYEPKVSFDCIVMSEVLEHLRRPAQAVARCVQWLAPGGSLLITTPNEHWESNEHLQEFSFERFSILLARSGADSVSIAYLRDAQERRRWLVGQATVAEHPQAPDTFSDLRIVTAIRGASFRRWHG